MADEDTGSEGSYIMIQNPDAPTEATFHSESDDDVEHDGMREESEEEGLPEWKDRLLDSLPFQQAELERLCLYYEDGHEFRFARLAEQTLPTVTRRGAALLEWIETELLPDQFAERVMKEAMELAVVPQESFSPFATAVDTTAPTDLPRRKLFLEAVAGGTGRRSPRMMLKIIHACCCYRPEKDTDTVGKVADATQLITLCYRLAMSCHLLQQAQTTEAEDLQTLKAVCMDHQTSIPTSLVDSLVKSNGGVPSVSMDTFVTWAEATAPHLTHILSTFLYLALSLIMEPKCTFSFPHLGATESTFIKSPIDIQGFTFACMDPRLSRKWHRLYTTEADGMAFTQIKMALIGYGGPTVLLIRPTTGQGAFGYFTTSFWKESRHFYGDSDSFLFRAEPTLGVYRPLRDTEEDNTYPDNNSSSTPMLPSKTQYKVGRNYMYLNTSTRSVIPDQLPHGICFGGTHAQPRLQLNESFENCTALVRDETYEEGPLLADDWDLHFDIDVLEVWGVGASEEEIQSALELGHKQRAVMESTLARSQHVDKTKFLDLFQTGLIPNDLYQHREMARGRHSFAIHNEHGGYKMDNNNDNLEISPLDPITSITSTNDNKGELHSGCFDDP